MHDECPFCNFSADRIALIAESSFALWDAYPVTEGHLLIVPKRHVAVWGELNDEERASLVAEIGNAQRFLNERYSPDGFNVGFNEGAAGGQTVSHFHIHVIPRRLGDMADPRGGVRHVIPAKANYLAKAAPGPDRSNGRPHTRALIAGGEDALIQHLLPNIDQAYCVDLAVAFVLDSGVRILQPHFQELLDRGGRLRLIAGDYLDVTDPSSLRRLLDLEGAVEQWIFETALLSFHPKSWVFQFADGSGIAIVGSSNLSAAALMSGVEWNYRSHGLSITAGWRDVLSGFENLLKRPEVKRLTHDWIDRYEKRRDRTGDLLRRSSEVVPEPPLPVPEPHAIQQAALSALKETRSAGYTAGLVVLATGLGKTWLSAFDSVDFHRILFVAHRDEILSQAMSTFRLIRPQARFGRYTGAEKDLQADVLFASIQTLGQADHLRNFPPDTFDYVVIDEFHHAAARTYRVLIDYFTPKFLIGITATPERTDGGDLLGLCQENLVFRCDMFEGIAAGLLSPFRYFGVPDEVDYAQIPWRSTAFDEKKLTEALATKARAQNALDQYRLYGGAKALGFCCSLVHADFMARFFEDNGLRAVAIHSGETSAPRVTSLERLRAGDLDIVFSVDILNEGVDLPDVDTVLMLRPTESAVIWIQQFGRGLRLAGSKRHLNVVDYIGNHRVFLTKVRALLQPGEGDRPLALALEQYRLGELHFPRGCEVTYDLKAIEILEALLQPTGRGDALEAFYADFRLRHGIRPTALEVHHAGFDPHRTGHGGWFGFVSHMGDLDQGEIEAYQRHKAFFEGVSVTQMSKSYKMLLLKAMLAENALPGNLPINTLTRSFINIAKRNPQFSQDINAPLSNLIRVQRLLEENPVDAWTGGRGMGGRIYFTFEHGIFSTSFTVSDENLEAFRKLISEIIDWRLGQYLDRSTDQIYDETLPGRMSEAAESGPLRLGKAELWHDYVRERIPALFGTAFNRGSWHAGIVVKGRNMILLVTLAKGDLAAGNQYVDRFIDAETFCWQTQTKTTRKSKHGRIISGSERDYQVHLFVRPSKLRGSRAAPFTYCGAVEFVDWDGDKPITVTWKLQEPVPERFRRMFKIGRSIE